MLDTSKGLAFTYDGVDFYHGWHGGYFGEFIYCGKTKLIGISNEEVLCQKPVDLPRLAMYAIARAQREVDRDLARRQT